MPASRPKYSLLACALLLVGFLAWWFFKQDPKTAFLEEVGDMVAEVNAYQHGNISEHLSPEAVEYIENHYTSVRQALVAARRIDSMGHHQYRIHNLALFYAGDYAEVEFERSEPNGTFSGESIFPVPFLYNDGKWWVAGGFRTERDFQSPLRMNANPILDFEGPWPWGYADGLPRRCTPGNDAWAGLSCALIAKPQAVAIHRLRPLVPPETFKFAFALQSPY